MKKFFPYILMLTIIAGTLAPFSVVLNSNKNLAIEKNEASAGYFYHFFDKEISSERQWYEYYEKEEDCEEARKKVPNSVSSCAEVLRIRMNTEINNIRIDGSKIIYDIKLKPDVFSRKFLIWLFRTDINGKYIDHINITEQLSVDEDAGTYLGKDLVFDGFKENTSYFIYAKFDEIGSNSEDMSKRIQLDFKDKDYKQNITETIVVNNSAESMLPACSWTFGILGDGTFTGCLAQGLYYAIFVPTSWLFGFAGQFFDWVFDYSLDDASYKSEFVTEGWKIVRDICNVFFIFILLYVAISMILDLGGAKSKQMIVNVIIIGLLINFSMFFAKVIIDSSNILTRVFYNSEAIKEKTQGNQASSIGGFELANKEGDEISLSAGIVSQVNPQNIIRHATKITATDGGAVTGGREATDSLTGSGFILVTLLATLVNLIGIFVFISVALMFIARVIGLWFAMIFAPFAFLSYIVPAMSSIKMIGWKNWWSDLIALSFMAPLFMFMMYLLILFLGGSFGDLIDPNNNGSNFILKTIVSFAFIMIMLMTAKKMAKEYSGSMGKTITGAVTAGGAMLLGGAALGAAWAGRKTIGSVSKNIQNDTARKKDYETFGGYKDWSLGKKLNPLAYVKQVGKTASAAVAQSTFTSWEKDGKRVSLGKGMQGADKGFGEKTHSTSMLDQKAKSEFGHLPGNENVKYKDLKETDQAIVKKEIDKDEISKSRYGKQFKDLGAQQAGEIQTDYNEGMRAIVDKNGKVRIDHKDSINTGVDDDGNAREGEKIKSDSIVDFSKESASIGEFVQALRKGSYDIRNLSQMKSSNKGAFGMGVGIIASVAAGVRMGMKQGVGADYGKGQKDLFKDLENVITESLKNVKINVSGGEGDKAGGGHAKEVKSVGH